MCIHASAQTAPSHSITHTHTHTHTHTQTSTQHKEVGLLILLRHLIWFAYTHFVVLTKLHGTADKGNAGVKFYLLPVT